MAKTLIFISYRRADTQAIAEKIYDKLCNTNGIGIDRIYFDKTDPRLARDFSQNIRTAARQCKVMLVIIGPQWESITDSKGLKRLHDEEDFVRKEVKIGLRGRKAIPVIVDGAEMPDPAKLPKSIRRITRRQGRKLDPANFDRDLDNLISLVKDLLSWKQVRYYLSLIIMLMVIVGIFGVVLLLDDESQPPENESNGVIATTAIPEDETPTPTLTGTPHPSHTTSAPPSPHQTIVPSATYSPTQPLATGNRPTDSTGISIAQDLGCAFPDEADWQKIVTLLLVWNKNYLTIYFETEARCVTVLDGLEVHYGEQVYVLKEDVGFGALANPNGRTNASFAAFPSDRCLQLQAANIDDLQTTSILACNASNTYLSNRYFATSNDFFWVDGVGQFQVSRNGVGTICQAANGGCRIEWSNQPLNKETSEQFVAPETTTATPTAIMPSTQQLAPTATPVLAPIPYQGSTIFFDRTEVTLDGFAGFIGIGGYRCASASLYWATPLPNQTPYPCMFEVEETNLPSGQQPYRANWYEANAYCRWKGGRLPTRDEWQVATGTDSTTNRPLNTMSGEIQEVASYPPNSWGLYDMEGNVAEWTQTQVDDAGTTFIVIGRSFLNQRTEPNITVTQTRAVHLTTNPDIGFRCVYDRVIP